MLAKDSDALAMREGYASGGCVAAWKASQSSTFLQGDRRRP